MGHRDFQNHMVCDHCGLVLKIPGLQEGVQVSCPRCHSPILTFRPDTTDRTLALALTGLVFFIVANTYPFLAMRIEGFIQETTMLTGIIGLYNQGMPGLATLVLMTALVFPLLQILGLVYIYLPIKFGKMAWEAAWVLRMLQHLKPWGMMEVYLLGILVSMIKLAKMATIIPGLASVAFLVLIFILAATFSGMNPNDIWQRLRVPDEGKDNFSGPAKVTGCHSCRLICQVPLTNSHYNCPRCGAPVHYRKANSINRTWALVIAAAIFYFPANIFPVTYTAALGNVQADTIMSGVIYFLLSGSWHIALIIFVASVVIPLMKLIVLVFLLISVRRKSKWQPEERVRLYRITEAVGRWSMVDVYVVTILVSLVQLGPMANITAGQGAIYFSAVVVITMFAAESFDPRLIWDKMEER